MKEERFTLIHISEASVHWLTAWLEASAETWRGVAWGSGRCREVVKESERKVLGATGGPQDLAPIPLLNKVPLLASLIPQKGIRLWSLKPSQPSHPWAPHSAHCCPLGPALGAGPPGDTPYLSYDISLFCAYYVTFINYYFFFFSLWKFASFSQYLSISTVILAFGNHCFIICLYTVNF